METREVASNAARGIVGGSNLETFGAVSLVETLGGLNSGTFGAVSLGGTAGGSNFELFGAVSLAGPVVCGSTVEWGGNLGWLFRTEFRQFRQIPGNSGESQMGTPADTEFALVIPAASAK
jgi:hypothetical protein